MKSEFSKSKIKFMRMIWAGGILLFILFFLLIGNSDSASDWDLYYLNKLEKEYKGKVVKKYIDKNNRSTPTIQLDDNSIVLLISEKWYNQFETGDYLFKERGSIVIKLIKKSTQDTLFFNYKDIEK